MENYEQKYKDCLNRAKAWAEGTVQLDDSPQGVIKYVFPELAELEDEKIRKTLIRYMASVIDIDGVKGKDIIAWLEKQGEQHSAIRWYDVSLIPQEMEELLVEWDSEDATWHEIAFYHADTKTFWNGTIQVENVTRWCYIIDLLEKQGTSYTKRDVDDAFVEGMAFAKHELEKQGEQKSADKCVGCNNVKGCVTCVDGSQWAHISEHKPAWSEEDEKKCQETIDWFEKKCFPYALESENPARESIKWLKSLKTRVQPKQEWSKEDEEHVNSLLKRLEGLCRNEFERTRFAINEDEYWLKSLKQRPHFWRPSDEQIRALHDLNLTGNISYAGQGQFLVELYNDLKKLKA